jgi:hypothetical protein
MMGMGMHMGMGIYIHTAATPVGTVGSTPARGFTCGFTRRLLGVEIFDVHCCARRVGKISAVCRKLYLYVCKRENRKCGLRWVEGGRKKRRAASGTTCICMMAVRNAESAFYCNNECVYWTYGKVV